MDDFENQVTEQETAGQESVVDSQQEDVTDQEQDTGEGGKSEPAPQKQIPSQSHQDNAAAKAARIRAEQETTERLRKRYDDQIAGMGIPNPYTGKPFRSFKEFQEYGEQFRAERMKQEAKRQGKTVEELQEEEENRSYLSRKRREEKEQQQAMKALQERQDFVRSDLAKFVEKFPDVDPGKLEKNPKFQKFAKNRLYKEPLSELYADYLDIVSDAERAAIEKAASKNARGTGGGQSGGKDLMTPSQREALEEWNRDNPDMKMTAKEFLSR